MVLSTATATTAPSPTPVPTVDPATLALCFPDTDAMTVAQSGDILFTLGNGPLGYAQVQLPDSTLPSPYRLQGTIDNNFKGSFVDEQKVNPYGVKNMSLYLSLCNASKTVPHTFQGASVKIASLTPRTNPLNTWIPLPCDTTYFTPPSVVTEVGGCGGSIGPTDFSLSGAFGASDSQGASALAKSDSGPLALSVLPTKSASGLVAMGLPITRGAYTFSISLTIDGIATTFGGMTSPITFDPSPVVWNGAACTNPAMLSLIPTSPIADYICPVS